MATTSQQLNVGIDADASGLMRATADASKALGDLQTDAKKLDTTPIDVTPEFHLNQINKNIGMVQAALRKLDQQRADPNVELDSAKFLAEQRRLFNELNRLKKERVTVEADLHVNTTGWAQLQAGLTEFQQAGGTGGGIAGLAGGLRAIGTGGAAAAGGIAAVGAAAVVSEYQLGQMAADLETTKIQLDAVTGGMADELLPTLQDFSAASPFGLDEVVSSTRRLAAAGVGLAEIPGYLEDLGEVAAASGVPLEQIATVFAQMEGKGAVTFEEMQQLAEAGLPVWQTLADHMGLTVQQVQALATEGKLGADAIDELHVALGDTFGGTMEAQANSFNGQMSTLADNLSQIGQNLGTLVLPFMSDFARLLNDAAGAANDASQKIAGSGDGIRDAWVGALGAVSGMGGGTTVALYDQFIGQSDDAAASTHEFAGQFAELASSLTSAKLAANAAEEELADVIDMDVRTKVHFIISQDDFRETIEESIRGTEDEKAVVLPAKVRINEIAGLGDRQQQLIDDLASFVDAGFAEGARRAQLNPNFDEEAWQAQVTRKVGKLAIKAGIDPSQVNGFLEHILGLKPVVPFGTKVTNGSKTAAELDHLAQARNTMYKPHVDSGSYANASSQLSTLAADRYSTIFVTTQQRRGARAMDEVMNGAGPAVSQRSVEPRSLAPRQTPVAVYLDGAEIADQLSLRTDRLATVGSVRRTA